MLFIEVECSVFSGVLGLIQVMKNLTDIRGRRIRNLFFQSASELKAIAHEH